MRSFTDDERAFMNYIDEIQGAGEGLLLIKGDGLAFEVAMNDWLREEGRY